MNTLSILTALVKGGMTPIAACAMGGNMMAESGMKSNNLQDTYEQAVGYNDQSYTAAVDSGDYSMWEFVGDKAGYGLCQWTWHTRKANLFDFAKARGKSIGDEEMQVEFCLWEMKYGHSDLWRYLQATKDLYSAAEKICKEYEQPAINNVNERFGFAQQMYKDYGAILEQIAKGNLSAADAAPPNLSASGTSPDRGGKTGEARGSRDDAEPTAYIMGTVQPGEHTPEAAFLMAHLNRLGYDVLWLGLDACLKDFQQKKGLAVDGICGEKTWEALLK